MNATSVSTHTACVHSGTKIDPRTRGSVTPIYPSTSYGYLDTEIKAYPRYFNIPNHQAVVEKIAALEHAESGLLFSSGMAAISTTLLSFLKQGDHAVIQKGLYGGTSGFIRSEFSQYGLAFTYTESVEPAAFEAAIRPETKLIFVETPSNPLLTVTDLQAVVAIARKHQLLTIIDNTFASPINQNPIDLGIDIVTHSATKYLGGHSDLCAGAVVGGAAHMETIMQMSRKLGGSLNAETCYLLERSIKTLAIRVAQQNRNAQQIAEFLTEHPAVAQVYYPGLPSHPGHEIARQQMHGFGGMLSFELKSGINSIDFQQTLKIVLPSMSLGGVETTICSPSLTSHEGLSPEQREREGLRDGLLRLSVGIEDAHDLITDLTQALERQQSHSVS